MDRRSFILASFFGVSALVIQSMTGAFAMGFFQGNKDKDKKNNKFPYELSDKEWMNKLSKEQYYVLRDHGTERAGTSQFNDEKRNGSYHCAGCDNELFSSQHKFDSGTGWPSYYQPVREGAVGTTKDYKLLIPRVEVHCSNCGGHLGHVFEDGPEPTGLRYCINGVALTFKPT